MSLIHRDPQNISAVLLADGWHRVGEGDVAKFIDVGWGDYHNPTDEQPTETGLALEFWSDKYDESILVPVSHLLAYRLDFRARNDELDEKHSV
jgi:hypothetical protein